MTAARLLATAALLLTACKDKAPLPVPAAKIDHPVTESQLTTVTLSADAVRRLAIETVAAEQRSVPPSMTVGGEIITPPGRTVTMSAPVAGTVIAPAGGVFPAAGAVVRRGQSLIRLVPLTGTDVGRTDEEVAVAEARARQAELEAARMEELGRDSLVSQREVEKARADLQAAQATLEAARSRLERQRTGSTEPGPGLTALTIASPDDGVLLDLQAGSGQVVTAGAPLLTVARMDRLWVKAPVFSGTASQIDRAAGATVHLLGPVGQAPTIRAHPVTSPPTADPLSASVDVYFELDATAGLRPGQRVDVSFPLRGSPTPSIVVPLSALVYDQQGGAWVYIETGERTYQRRRVEVQRTSGEWAVIGRGLEPGLTVVRTGVAELFGTEFGAGH